MGSSGPREFWWTILRVERQQSPLVNRAPGGAGRQELGVGQTDREIFENLTRKR